MQVIPYKIAPIPMLHTVRYFFLILLSKLNLCLYIYIYDYIYKTQTLLADGTSVLTCQNSCSSDLSCTGGCSIINGQYSGNYRTSCCTTDSCNLLTTTVSTRLMCYVGTDASNSLQNCTNTNATYCQVFFFNSFK
jgi:hypothetical protein